MKLSTPVRRLLLVAASDEVESDSLVALNMSEAAHTSAGVFELAFFCLQRDADFLDILHLLNLLRDGFFEAVYLIPPAASWSRDHTLGIVVVGPAADRKSATIQSWGEGSLVVRSSVSTVQSSSRWRGAQPP